MPCVAPTNSCRTRRRTSARLSEQGRKRFAQHQQPEKHNQGALLRSSGLEGVSHEKGYDTVKATTLIGMALIILGVVALVYQGITYTTREKVVDLGPLKITADKDKNIPLPPILGALALAGGVVLVLVGARKS